MDLGGRDQFQFGLEPESRRRSANWTKEMVGCRFLTVRWITKPSADCPIVVSDRTRSPRENGGLMVSPPGRNGHGVARAESFATRLCRTIRSCQGQSSELLSLLREGVG